MSYTSRSLPVTCHSQKSISFFAMTRDMEACTSVCWFGDTIPDSVELPSNILSITGFNDPNDWQLSQKHKDTLNRNISQLDGKRTTFEFKDMWVSPVGDLRGRGHCSFTIRFLGPSSGHLKLQLIHHSTEPKECFTAELEEDNSCDILLSDTFTLANLTIWNGSRPPYESAGLTFVPNVRNHLTCTFKTKTSAHYVLRDIQLLNENGLPYDPANNGNGVEDADSNPPREASVCVEEVASGERC